MAQITFETKNRIQAAATFPKLKLAKNERARVAVLENPQFGWVHNLNTPKVVDGQVQYVTRTKKDGTTQEVPVMQWVGTHRCKGESEIIEGEGRGLDVKHCTLCKETKENPSRFEAPKRRFAGHVVKYNTKPGTYDLVDGPYSVQIFVWAFSEFLFDKLIGINSVVGSLQNHDLLLGPCTDATYQKFDVNYALDAQWQANEEYKKITVATLKANRADDLMAYVARDSEQKWIDRDIEAVHEGFDFLIGKTREPATAAKELPGLAVELDSLLETTKPAETAAAPSQQEEPKKEAVGGWDDLLNV